MERLSEGASCTRMEQGARKQKGSTPTGLASISAQTDTQVLGLRRRHLGAGIVASQAQTGRRTSAVHDRAGR